MNPSTVLSEKDTNSTLATQAGAAAAANANTKPELKSMEYHRQMLKSKMEEESGSSKYVSPSDTIMSPCTAKLSALKGRQAEKAKPRSLFAQASAKKFAGENVFGARNAGSTGGEQDNELTN